MTVKISDIVAASNVSAADMFEIETQAGASRRATAAQILAYINGQISGGGGVAANSFFAHKNNVDQTSIASGGFVKVTFPTERWDTGGYWDATNSIFQPTVAGKHRLDVVLTWTANGAYRNYVTLYKNASRFIETVTHSSLAGSFSAMGSFIVDMNGSTDTIEVYCQQVSGGNRDIQGDPLSTWITGYRIE